jgi:hypothetical protein
VIPLEKSESDKSSNKPNETSSINESTSEKETQPLTKPKNVSQKEMTPSEEKPSLFDMISKMQEKLINNSANSMASSSSTLAQTNLNNANIHKSK